MRRAFLILGGLIGLALAFVLCGGVSLIASVGAAMNAQPVSVATLGQ